MVFVQNCKATCIQRANVTHRQAKQTTNGVHNTEILTTTVSMKTRANILTGTLLDVV